MFRLPLTLLSLSLTSLSVVQGYAVDVAFATGLELVYIIHAQDGDPPSQAVDIFLADAKLTNSTLLDSNVILDKAETMTFNSLLNGTLSEPSLYTIEVRPHGLPTVLAKSTTLYIDFPAHVIIIPPASRLIPTPTVSPTPPSISHFFGRSTSPIPLASAITFSVTSATYPSIPSTFSSASSESATASNVSVHALIAAALVGGLIVLSVILCVVFRRRRQKPRFQLLSEKPREGGASPMIGPSSQSSRNSQNSDGTAHRYNPSFAPTYETNCPQSFPSMPRQQIETSRISNPFYSPADDISQGCEAHHTPSAGCSTCALYKRGSVLAKIPPCHHMAVHDGRHKDSHSSLGEGAVTGGIEREGKVEENPFADSKDQHSSLFSSYRQSKMEPLPQYEAHSNNNPHILLRNSKTQCFCSSCI